MNNLILILIILINLIEPFMVIEFNNGLVFIKPENLSKTELVEKFKKLSSSKTLKELKNIKNEDKKDEDKISIKEFLKSFYLRLSGLILKIKNVIIFMNKISLFAILIKYLGKIKIFNAISEENKSEIIENKSEIVKNKSEIVENRSDSKIITSEIPSNGTELKNEKIVHDKTMGGDEKES